MNPRLKQAIQFIIFFGLGIGLTWWQFNSFKPEDKAVFFKALKTANYGWFALAVFVGSLAHLSRAIRWQQLLTPLQRKAGLGNRFYAVMIGYLANYGIPRSGEVIRCGMLKTSDDVPFAEAFGTVVVERIIDTLCLLLVFVIVILTQFSQLSTLFADYIGNPAAAKFEKLLNNTNALIITAVIIVVVIAGFWMLRKKISALFTGKLGGFVKGFKSGIMAVRNVPNPGWFIFHSLFIWTGYLSALYICFFCFPVTSGLSINTALILLIFGTFGVVFTPGGIGAYQIIITEILVAVMLKTYHVTVADADAASYAWLSWGSQVATVILFTGIAAVLKPVLNKIGASAK